MSTIKVRVSATVSSDGAPLMSVKKQDSFSCSVGLSPRVEGGFEDFELGATTLPDGLNFCGVINEIWHIHELLFLGGGGECSQLYPALAIKCCRKPPQHNSLHGHHVFLSCPGRDMSLREKAHIKSRASLSHFSTWMSDFDPNLHTLEVPGQYGGIAHGPPRVSHHSRIIRFVTVFWPVNFEI